MDKILIIEDDVEINTLLTDFLKENGYVVYSQYDGLHVLDFLHKEKIDLIILDIMLPYRSGDIILADIRRQFTIPVLIISAKETTQNKIDLLRLGADDYITKPFDMEEVLARIESNLRRVQFENRSAACLQYGDLCLDLEKKYLYSVHGDLTLASSYEIKEDGTLKHLNTIDIGGKNPVDITVDAENKHVIIATLQGGTLYTVKRNLDGSLGEIVSTFTYEGKEAGKVSTVHQCLWDQKKNYIFAQS